MAIIGYTKEGKQVVKGTRFLLLKNYVTPDQEKQTRLEHDLPNRSKPKEALTAPKRHQGDIHKIALFQNGFQSIWQKGNVLSVDANLDVFPKHYLLTIDKNKTSILPNLPQEVSNRDDGRRQLRLPGASGRKREICFQLYPLSHLLIGLR